MFTTLLTLLALSTTAQAKAPASCMGLSGQALQVCNEQRFTEQAAQLAATKRELEALEKTCEQVCTDSPSAPATTAPRTSTGPSKTWLVLDAYGKRLDELERLVRDGTVSDEDFDREITAINADITRIDLTLNDHEARIKALENAEPAITAPPMLIEGPVGPQGPAGANGRDGRDGRPAEVTALVGVGGAHSTEANIVGIEASFRVAGRLTSHVRLGGYGSGFIAGGNDLGFGVGGYLGYDGLIWSWFRPGVTFGWREIGLDIAPGGSRRSFQGVELAGNLEFNPTGKWVVGVHGGAFLEEDPAFVWGIDTGFRF